MGGLDCLFFSFFFHVDVINGMGTHTHTQHTPDECDFFFLSSVCFVLITIMMLDLEGMVVVVVVGGSVV